MMRSHSSLH